MNRTFGIWKSVAFLFAFMGSNIAAQGIIDSSALLFRNGRGGGIPNIPVLDATTGDPLAVMGLSTPFTVQLYWSPTEPMGAGDLMPTENVTSFFPAPGIFYAFGAPERILAPAGTYWFQVKVWETEFGPTFEEASLQPAARRGESNIFTLQTVAFGTDFPLALSQGGLESFTVSAIPEPSSMMLLLVGAGALLGVRRRVTSATSHEQVDQI